MNTRASPPAFVSPPKRGLFRALILGDELIRVVLQGGFPEAIARPSERRRQDWALSYLEAVLGRDLREIADVERLTDRPRFARLLAQHDAQLANFSEFGRDLIKAPKLHFVDSGILASARGLTIERAIRDRAAFGAVLETFVVGEVAKLLGGSNVRANLFHFRDHAGREVDLVLERDDGTIAGIEVKASATVTGSDFAGLRTLAEACGDRFAGGLVLYDSGTAVSFGDRLAAVPMASLWN